MKDMDERMNYEDFKPLFGAWAEKFKPFIEGEEFYKIYQKIKADAKTERILPISDNVFRVFQLTKMDDIKVVIYLGDPYPRTYRGGIPQATGIPMSCDNSPDGKLQPSLEKFYDAIDAETEDEVQRNKSLQYLLEQGVLLMNTDLTVKKDKSTSHEGYWIKFQEYFLGDIMFGTTGIIYVLLGDVSRAMERYINPLGNYILGGKKDKIEHPVAASYKHTDWDSKGLFKKINRILRDNGKEMIVWDPAQWEVLKEVPF